VNGLANREFGRPQIGLLGSILLGLLFSITPMLSVLAGVLFPAMAGEFHWSRSQISLGVSVCFLSVALTTPLVGYLIRARTARKVILAYALAYPLSLLAFRLIDGSYGSFIGLMALLGVVGAGTTAFAFFSILPQWFNRRLGTALGIGMIGPGLGQSSLPILVDALNRHEGWRASFVAIALLNAFLVLPALWLWYRIPRLPHEQRPAQIPVARAGMTLAEARRTSTFWLMVLAFFLVSAVGAGCIIHMIPIVTAKGFSSARAAQALSATGLALLISRPVAGALLDRFGAIKVGTPCFAVAAVGTVLLARSAAFPLTFLGAFLVGVGLGAEGDLMAFMVRRYFGEVDFPRIYSVFGLVYGAGPLLGPPILGFSVDRLDSYVPGLYLFTLSALAGALLLPAINRSPLRVGSIELRA
jgi:MFS transporter, OFA family, oxalate/formate antiporter